MNNMTQEQKQLLLVDLCARLPYHPILNWKFIDNTSKDEELKELSDLYIWWITKAQDCEAKPYLRPMASMTEKEREAFRIIGGVLSHNTERDTYAIAAFTPEAYDWLNSHHFDYRGLIRKGLALKAPEDMYKIKIKNS